MAPLHLKKILIIFCCAISFQTFAQNKVTDTAKKNIADTVKKDLFTAPDTVKKLHSNPLSLIPPAIAIGYGVSSFIFQPVRRVDYYLYGITQRSNSGFHTNAESYFLFTPIVMVY